MPSLSVATYVRLRALLLLLHIPGGVFLGHLGHYLPSGLVLRLAGALLGPVLLRGHRRRYGWCFRRGRWLSALSRGGPGRRRGGLALLAAAGGGGGSLV